MPRQCWSFVPHVSTYKNYSFFSPLLPRSLWRNSDHGRHSTVSPACGRMRARARAQILRSAGRPCSERCAADTIDKSAATLHGWSGTLIVTTARVFCTYNTNKTNKCHIENNIYVYDFIVKKRRDFCTSTRIKANSNYICIFATSRRTICTNESCTNTGCH